MVRNNVIILIRNMCVLFFFFFVFLIICVCLLQEVAIFVFEKKLLDRYSKQDKDTIIDVLKRGVSQLTRLRHPRILSVLHPLEESR